MTALKILFLAANPDGTSRLTLDEEIRAITQKIQLSTGRDLLDVITAWAVQPDDLLQNLNQHRPHIVHFSGHGSPAGALVLVDQRSGQPKLVSPTALKELFRTLKDNIQLVLLNACYSRIQGQAIAEVIDYVIGMNKDIGDEAARVFAASFYRALGFGRTVQEAFDQARTALLLEDISEEQTPELLVKSGVNTAARILQTDLACAVLTPAMPTLISAAERRALNVRVHRAYFVHQTPHTYTSPVRSWTVSDPIEYYFINLTNVSPSRVVEVTHVWYENGTDHIPVFQVARSLPVRLDPDESWETWIEPSRLPDHDGGDVYRCFRARISTGQVFTSEQNTDVPPIGTVPGGPAGGG